MTDTLRDLATKAIELTEKAIGTPAECGCQHYTDYREYVAFARDALPRLAEGYLDREQAAKNTVNSCMAIAKEANELADKLYAAEAKLAIAREALGWVTEHPVYRKKPIGAALRVALEKIK